MRAVLAVMLAVSTALAACGRGASRRATTGDDLAAYLAATVLRDTTATACAYERLGQQQDTLYVWTLCRAASGQAASLPLAVRLRTDGFPIAHRQPRDGSAYAEDVERFFPPSLQREVLHPDTARTARLAAVLSAPPVPAR